MEFRNVCQSQKALLDGVQRPAAAPFSGSVMMNAPGTLFKTKPRTNDSLDYATLDILIDDDCQAEPLSLSLSSLLFLSGLHMRHTLLSATDPWSFEIDCAQCCYRF